VLEQGFPFDFIYVILALGQTIPVTLGQDPYPQEVAMSKYDPKELLRPAFPGLEEEDLAELASVAEIRGYPANTVLCREGEFGDTFFLIVEGQACISKFLDDENPRRVLHWLGPGEFFGEIALIQGSTRTATVDTEGSITVLEIHRDSLMRVLERSAPMALRLVLRFTSRLRDADQTAIDDLRRINEELRRAYHNLERLDRAKADFISVIGHELRTPLTVISGYANMLRSAPAVRDDPSLRLFADGITTSIDRLQTIINRILDVSKIDTAVVKVRKVPTSIVVLIKEAEAAFSTALKERNLEFKIDAVDQLPYILADSDLLYKVFYHLIANAIKYTPDGGQITVSGRVDRAETGQDVIEIVVADTGIGIDQEHHELIFDKFYQTGEVMLHSSSATKFKGGGPGLGLAIAKGAIEAHGGEIWVESPGHDEVQLPGSRFFVRLPLTEWHAAKAALD
jgi:signal transduction histidine kinase